MQHLFRQVFPSLRYLLLFTTFYALPPDDQSSRNMNIDSPLSIAVDPHKTSPISIKDHPLRELIIALAKAIHASEPKHRCKNTNARDYLLQALHIIDNPKSEITIASWTATPIVPDIAVAAVAPLPDMPTHAKVLKKLAKSVDIVSPAAPRQTNPVVAPSNATHKGTKPSQVYSKVPELCSRDLLPYRLNTALLQKELEMVHSWITSSSSAHIGPPMANL